jgi:hypothetical protein
MRRCLVALIALLFCMSPVFSQQAKVLAPHRPIAPRLPDDPPKTGPLRSMVGGLWMIDANFKSTIYIKNDVEIAPVTVTPILYLSNGKKVTLADVTLEPSGTATVSVNDGLNQKGISPWATLNGYVEIQYKWPWDPLCVTVMSVDTVHSVIFTNGLRPLQPLNPSAKALLAQGAMAQTIEGMWWKQEAQVTGFVTLSNTTERDLKAQLQVSDNAGQSIGQHSVTISPHGTKTVNLGELQSAASNSGGLRVTYTGGINDLLPNGGLEDQASGYSASVPFEPSHGSHAADSTQGYAELGLMSGAADPMMQFPAGTTFTPYSLLRNVSGQPASVTPSIYWMEGGNARSSRIQSIKLLPYQTQSLDVPALLSLAGLPNFNGSFNLVFDVIGSVLMTSGSVDQKNTYVFEVLPTSISESASKGLGYWSTKNGDDTMVSLWNPADEAQDFIFTLFFSGGHYDLPVRLGPRTSRMFNISEIVQNQIPDNRGNLIPPGVQEGSSKISGLHDENEHILVAVDAAIYNVRKATCGYICNNCNGMVSDSIAILGFAVAPTHTVQMSLKTTWNTGVQRDLTNLSSWSSSQTSIATVTTTGSARGKVTGVAAGDVTVNGSNLTEPWAGQQCGSPPPACPPDQGFQSSGSGSVFQITNVAPSPLIVGSAGQMAIQGTKFNTLVSPVTVTVTGGGVTVSNATVTNDSLINGSYTVASNAAVGVQTLTVSSTGSDGGQGASASYSISIAATSSGTVTGISPAQGLIGSTQSNVTISGSGFGSSPTVNAGSGITVTYSSRSDSQIVANFAVSSTASPGNNSVIVTTTSGLQLQPVNFYVQTPSHFQRFDFPPQAPGGLGPVISLVNGTAYTLTGAVAAVNLCGVYENFVFGVADQRGTEITNGNVKITEVFSNVLHPPGPTPATNVAVNLVTDGMQDIQIWGHTYPTCLGTNDNQALDMTWTVTVGSTVYPVATIVHITKGNFNGTQNVTSTITTP